MSRTETFIRRLWAAFAGQLQEGAGDLRLASHAPLARLTAIALHLSIDATITGPFHIEPNRCSHDVARASALMMRRP
jgi:hypothetical protein